MQEEKSSGNLFLITPHNQCNQHLLFKEMCSLIKLSVLSDTGRQLTPSGLKWLWERYSKVFPLLVADIACPVKLWPMQQPARCMEPWESLVGGISGNLENYELRKCEIHLGNRD